ncbi:hypothetical protein CAPTEDRAFT_224718 [Capitella teleta]|uniref:Structural maintenance of chromosomes protein 4 n=1 Tax=Capitella teleta TaxID=283909 RepID=R7UA63_CAPTE|nr:hypothetical protein CAPTEDRAFT_224718 [Capitella teleta]|eukprot:ELU02991.1 hypothetical protein CAPTEDRAFT_224718 [Capitella teleta]
MITHIVNENFKSYAGIQTLGPFHKSFSAIVGPNGSGKSNMIDSMLFVFGYRANKIRSKKISVLIHNSEKHPNLTSCTVSVNFQKIIDTGPGEDEFDIVPDSKFVVSRTAFKDNSSYYRVNDRKVTYKEVATLLRSSGIDLDHNRFLILQGEVEQIAMMKPKAVTEHEDGMLEFLEDIVGSSRFKEPIDGLVERVEQLNEIRSEKLNRVKAVAKEKDDLEGVKNEALGFLEEENQITLLKNKLYQKFLLECSKGEEKTLGQKAEAQEKVDAMKAKMAEMLAEKDEKLKLKKSAVKKFNTLSKECEEKKEAFIEFEKQDVRCREDMTHSRGKGKKMAKQLEQEQKKLEELQQVPEKSERDIEELNIKLEKLEAEKSKEDAKLEKVMDSLKTETQDLQTDKDAKEVELAALQKLVNEAKSKYTIAQTELDLYNSQQASETRKLRDTNANLERVEGSIKEVNSSISELENRLPEAQSDLQKAKKELKDVCASEQKYDEQVRQTRVKVEDLRSSLESSKGRGKVLEALLELKKSGRMPGIHGRLGDLGAIDEKYDVAISTACGALDNIVVDTIATGQKAVEYLRKNNVGVATFILLDKMARWKDHCRKKISTPENVPRLFDLVRVQDQNVLPAFYHALRDTLVSKDLSQATKIAYGKTRYRVVTLNGQLIDQSGTMSGGGGRVMKGRMGSRIRSEVDPQQLSQLEDALNQSLAEQEISLKEQVKEQQKAVKAAAPDEKQLKEFEKKVGGLKKNYDKAKENASKLEDAVHELQRQILEIGGSLLKGAESRVHMVSTKIDQVMGLITKAKVAVKTAQRNTKKTEDKVASLQNDIEENKKHFAELEKEFKQLETDAAAVMEAHKKAQEDTKVVQIEVEEQTAAVNELEEREQNIQKEENELSYQLETWITKVKDYQVKVKHWKKERSRLELHKVDGLEEVTLKDLSPEELAEVNNDETQYQITLMEERNQKLSPNMAAIKEYKRKEEVYLKRVEELDKVTEMRDEQRKTLEECRKQRLDEFMAGFTVITEKLKEMYQMITLGGDAELELVDSLDPFSEGIVFSVRPPKKSWKNISNLSGGEKTLSSLALVFALHHYKPTPLYVMDEIDAALDFKNVSIVAHYIKERTKNAQFIIISLRNNMFELADRLVGIYKTYDSTKSVTINPAKIAVMPTPQLA